MYDSHRRGCHAASGRAALVILAALVTASCVYQPAPVYQGGPSKFERAWAAAQGAADDVGVTVTAADRSSGVIRGYRDSTDVTVSVWQQADGSVRVAFNVRAPSGPDAELADRLSRAYDRRMGR